VTEPKPINFRLIEDLRIMLARVAGGVSFLLLLVVAPCWSEASAVAITLNLVGSVLVLLGTFGRLWCAFYISGYKTRCLVTTGPYSMTRNPLYLSSLLGALGVAMATGLLTVTAAVALLFALAYPFVIRLEERLLRTVHGPAFDEYHRSVPALLPRPSLYQEPESYNVHTRLFRRALVEGLCFVAAFFVLRGVACLHAWHWLPVLVRWY
jgi:protein-S-isoprenylcysteine O-methyltransferase Ste14